MKTSFRYWHGLRQLDNRSRDSAIANLEHPRTLAAGKVTYWVTLRRGIARLFERSHHLLPTACRADGFRLPEL